MHRRSFDGASLFTGKRGNVLPGIPEPKRKEEPVHEILIEDVTKPEERKIEEHEDKRYREVKPFEPLYHPQYNRLYSSMRTEADWRYTVDNFSNGTLTTIANTLVSVAVTLKVTLDHKRLSEWPNGVQLYLVLRQFSMSPQTATFATVGSMDMYYQDTLGGQIIPLGDMTNNSSYNQGFVTLIPTPLTDPGILNIGNLQATLNSGATVGTYFWQLSFSYAYLLPSNEPHVLQGKKGGDIHVTGSTSHTRIATI